MNLQILIQTMTNMKIVIHIYNYRNVYMSFNQRSQCVIKFVVTLLYVFIFQTQQT